MEEFHTYWAFYIDEWVLTAWVIPALLFTHSEQKIKASFFVLLLALVLKLQVEMMGSLGFQKGFTGFVPFTAEARGLFVHSFFILLLIGISIFSKHTRPIIYLAACLSLFFLSFFLSSFIMLI